ncbi:MAG: DUF4382 domain-containing protein [Sediminibacterium sp.]|nr:DUF4382 domain-containing protein [Sediminibacterium sp.]
MKKTNNLLLVSALLAFVTFIVSSCSKNGSAESPLGQQTVSLYLTDAPVAYDQVLIDIRSVKVLVDTSKNTRNSDSCDFNRMGDDDHRGRPKPPGDSMLIWQDLNVSAGVYDILKLRNGVDTLLANKTVINGKVRLIKIEFGTSNSVVIDSVSYPLNIPVNAEGYVLIKLKGHEMEEYLPRKHRLWLDFDLGRSIVKEKNGAYYLKPFFKYFVEKQSASISGKIIPFDASPLVTVYGEGDTAYAIPNPDGRFKLRGLKDGTYSVEIKGHNGYIGKTITGVVVAKPKETELGPITLVK